MECRGELINRNQNIYYYFGIRISGAIYSRVRTYK